MTETTHTRSRRASLGGLILQLVAFGGILALAYATHSKAVFALAWYVLGGVPIWFVSLLVFRQRELAALEALDLEELRRERQATGGGEAMFGEEGAIGLAFRVAEARLRWMQRWLIPGFGLAAAAYLTLFGFMLWQRLSVVSLTIGSEGWGALDNVPIALVILAIVMLGTFLLSRYTSGMGRVAEWQLLRGCGSYLLGNVLAIVALMICLGVAQYTGVGTWEQTLAYIIPVLMVILAIETAVNFVLDVYRPRTAGVEPRACFDSRLLGLLAEPGGIASSVADALNYQFGFQVSHTWFYQLLERTFVPLLAAGAVALWLLTCLVVVQPYERVIIARFGRQLNAGGATGTPAPLEPGLHFKLPWPIDVAQTFNTGQLHQISVGWADFAAQPNYSTDAKAVLLWTDESHLGLEHFDFLISPGQSPGGRPESRSTSAPADVESTPGNAAPVHVIRMEVAVQYRIRADRLDRYSRVMNDPSGAIRDIAWEELVRYNASSTADFLMGRDRTQISEELRRRISERVRDIGLEVVCVAVTNVHPEMSVAQSYREVIGAEQQKVAAIREARVTEEQRLSAAAGDARRARAIAKATLRAREATERANTAAQSLRAADEALVAPPAARLMESAALFHEQIAAAARLDDARESREQVDEDYALGLGQTAGAQEQAAQAVRAAETQYQAADAALERVLASFRADAARRLNPAQVDGLIEGVAARVAGAYWEEGLDREFNPAQLGGEAAARLSGALADRWQTEMGAAAELVRVQNEREAYRAAPEIYKARRLMEVLVDGVKDARKYFLAFDPGKRTVRVRFLAEDQAGAEPIEWRTEEKRP